MVGSKVRGEKSGLASYSPGEPADKKERDETGLGGDAADRERDAAAAPISTRCGYRSKRSNSSAVRAVNRAYAIRRSRACNSDFKAAAAAGSTSLSRDAARGRRGVADGAEGGGGGSSIL